MKQQGIRRASAGMHRSFGDSSMEQDFAWTSRTQNKFNEYLCKSRGSSTAGNDAVARPALAVVHREKHK